VKPRHPGEPDSEGPALLAKEDPSASPADRKRHRRDRVEIRARRAEQELRSVGEDAARRPSATQSAASEQESSGLKPAPQAGSKRAERRRRRQLEESHSLEETGVVRSADSDSGERPRSGEEDDEIRKGDFSAEDDLEEAENLESVAARGRGARILSSPASASIVAADRHQATQLYSALRSAFESRGIELNRIDADAVADVTIHIVTPGNTPQLRSGRCATALILPGAGAIAEQRSLLAHAKAHRAAILSIENLIRRYGESRILSETGGLGERGAILAAAILRDMVLLGQTDSLPISISHIGDADDFKDANEVSDAPAELLKLLHWPGDAAPRSLRVPLDREIIEHFLNGNVPLSAGGKRDSVPYYIPSDWAKEVESRADQYALYGLDFVASVLNYWYLRANGVALPKHAALGNTLKERGVTASTLLMAAGAVILDALENSEKMPAAAWETAYVQRRARACELFLLCCRTALSKRLKFDEAVCVPVFRGLIELLERLRAATFIDIGSGKAVADAAMLIALSLPLRKTKFGALLLEETLEALRAYQLEAGMSRDGIWYDGFAQQCSVLAVLRLLAADLRTSEISAVPVAAAVTKLEPFAAAFVSFEGISPSIAESPPMAGKKPAAAAIRSPASLAGGPLREAVVFPEGGFFISRTGKDGSRPSSHLVLHARPAALGGPSLSFSVGLNSLLIGGGTLARRAPPEAKVAARENPAAHNAVRVNRQDYAQAENPGEQAIRIANAWEGEDWAAVRLINEAFSQARMARTVIHLKSACALLVIDELAAAEGKADFEIFWHLAHGLQNTTDLSFNCPKGGILKVAFGGSASVEMGRGGGDGIGWASLNKREVAPNQYLVCAIKADDAVCASFFRWSARAFDSQVQASRVADGWSASVALGDLVQRFEYRGGRLDLVA
jgi:hypothetical protein